jgi:hypothetical protein
MSDDAADEQDYFLYTGQRGGTNDVTHVRVHPSVRAIEVLAFCGCERLTTVILNDGLEEIEEWAFAECTSLVHIAIPPAVRAIKYEAFASCSGLTTVTLGDGLEEIGAGAFNECTSLVRIAIPPAVTAIHETAFNECSNLTNVRFRDEIEEFVSGESMRDWWDHGVHKKCLSTYCFFVRCNIPVRVGLMLPKMWQSHIHDMLGGIPSISPEGLNSYFRSIDSKLSVYEKLKDAPALLELVVWKSKITEQTDGNIGLLTTDMKMECRIDSLSMVEIIVPNVLSFLTDGDGGNNLVDGDEDDGGNSSMWDEDDDDSDDGDEHEDDDEDGDGDGDGDGDNYNDGNDGDDCDDDDAENDNSDGKRDGKRQRREGNPSV